MFLVQAVAGYLNLRKKTTYHYMYIIFKSHEKILIFPFESKEDDIPNVELHKTKYF